MVMGVIAEAGKRLRELSGAYLLYAGTIFLSAFLLFAVEPVVGKYILPWFGGSSSVWATSLLFFTTMLFLGYLYVFILTSTKFKYQAFIHSVVVVLIAIATLYSLVHWHAPFPQLDWTVGNTRSPYLNVLYALFTVIGGPFFLLATTGPLLQYWYGHTAEKEPYKLYAFSNAGSLLALVGYTTLIEPSSTLHVQENVWFYLFFLAASLILFATLFSRARSKKQPSVSSMRILEFRTLVTWVIYAALPAFMLVATTTEITQMVASVPLLWIVPLSIYLLTLILAFSGRGQSRYMPLLFFAVTVWAYTLLSGSYDTVVYKIASYLLLLFFCGLSAHAHLYKLRPEKGNLPLFYLLVAFGGMFGTLCASILAPLVFTDFWEFPLGLALCGCLSVYLLSNDFFPRILDERKIFLAKVTFPFVAIWLFTNTVFFYPDFSFVSVRNFYGVAKIEFANGVTALSSGTTLHGLQYTDVIQKYQPNTYYTSDSGIGRVIAYEEKLRKGNTLRVGVVGLGAGVVAAYCRPGDSYVFYEIDPKIISIAHTYFSYLSHCAGSVVHLGDARQVLQQELQSRDLGMYDILVVDAFNDDTIPVHLLTLQAFGLYTQHLKSSQSVIAIDVSNRYINLAPVVFRNALQMGFSVTEVFTDNSEWVILSKDPAIFKNALFKDSNASLVKVSAQAWTDDYTSIYSVLNLPTPH